MSSTAVFPDIWTKGRNASTTGWKSNFRWTTVSRPDFDSVAKSG